MSVGVFLPFIVPVTQYRCLCILNDVNTAHIFILSRYVHHLSDLCTVLHSRVCTTSDCSSTHTLCLHQIRMFIHPHFKFAPHQTAHSPTLYICTISEYSSTHTLCLHHIRLFIHPHFMFAPHQILHPPTPCVCTTSDCSSTHTLCLHHIRLFIHPHLVFAPHQTLRFTYKPTKYTLFILIFQFNYIVYDIFRTSKFSFSVRLIHAFLWHFCRFEIIMNIKNYKK